MDIYDQIKKMQSDMFKALETAFSSDLKKPMSDISQNPKFVTVNIKLPGVNKKNIVVNVTRKKVEIKAEVKKRKVKRGRKKVSKQESFKGFYRSISLPENLDIDRATSVFKNNTLTIKIPKIKVKKVRVR